VCGGSPCLARSPRVAGDCGYPGCNSHTHPGGEEGDGDVPSFCYAHCFANGQGYFYAPTDGNATIDAPTAYAYGASVQYAHRDAPRRCDPHADADRLR
jgi:hypothetical protein